jgi:hypothetical protein
MSAKCISRSEQPRPSMTHIFYADAHFVNLKQKSAMEGIRFVPIGRVGNSPCRSRLRPKLPELRLRPRRPRRHRGAFPLSPPTSQPCNRPFRQSDASLGPDRESPWCRELCCSDVSDCGMVTVIQVLFDPVLRRSACFALNRCSSRRRFKRVTSSRKRVQWVVVVVVSADHLLPLIYFVSNSHEGRTTRYCCSCLYNMKARPLPLQYVYNLTLYRQA